MTDLNDLDPTALRANDPGWTPAAVKAAKIEATARAKADKAKAKAAKAEQKRQDKAKFWAGFRGGVVSVWDFFMRNLLLAFTLAGVGGIASFEWVNGGTGWGDLYPGLPTAVVWAGAGGAILLYYVSVRQALEHIRRPEAERDIVSTIGWSLASIMAFCICVSGVFIATATNSVEAQQAAKASRVELQTLKGQVAALQTDLEVYNSEYWKLSETQIKRSIDSRIRTAKSAVGLDNLDPAGACAQPKLNFQQQRMCVRMNGGDDPTTGEAILGIRTELENVQREIKLTTAKEAKLAELVDQVDGFNVKVGDQTAEAMGQVFDEKDGAQSLQNIYWILSSFLLGLSGWGNDWAFERIEKLTRAARARKGKAA